MLSKFHLSPIQLEETVYSPRIKTHNIFTLFLESGHDVFFFKYVCKESHVVKVPFVINLARRDGLFSKNKDITYLCYSQNQGMMYFSSATYHHILRIVLQSKLYAVTFTYLQLDRRNVYSEYIQGHCMKFNFYMSSKDWLVYSVEFDQKHQKSSFGLIYTFAYHQKHTELKLLLSCLHIFVI